MMTSVMNLVMPLKQISMKKQRTEIIENNSKITRSYNIAQIRPSVTRYTTNEVDDKILSYEDCERNYDIKYPFSITLCVYISEI